MIDPIRYHSVIVVPISQPSGASIPLLCLDDDQAGARISNLAFLFVRKLQREGASATKIRKFVHALGLLTDYARVTRAVPAALDSQAAVQNLLEEFAEARLIGTIDTSGHDKLRLYWSPVRLDTASYDCALLEEFGRWVAARANFTPTTEWEAQFVIRFNNDYATSKRLSRSMFFHLKGAVKGRTLHDGPKLWQFIYAHRGRRGIGQRKDAPDSFPPNQVMPLIRSAKNIRDKLLFLLLAFGGPRCSEALHLFSQDIMGVDADGCAIVRIAHPEDAETEWTHNGREKRGKRSVFLRERYGLTPRTRPDEEDPLYLGWKGMVLDRAGHAFVQWISVDAGRKFWQLHVEYVRRYRARAPDNHPYYFINIRPAEFGTMMKHNNLDNQFYAATSRLGLRSNQEGVNPHGLRHFYGYMLANVLRVAPEVAQEALHHASLENTMVYYRLTPATVNASIREAMLSVPDAIEEKAGGKFNEILNLIANESIRLPFNYRG